MDERRRRRDPDSSVCRREPATHGLRTGARVVDILRPTPDLLAHDPAMIAGFESLGRRVILQAFADAAWGDGEARAFLTAHKSDGWLAHWVRQAGLTMPLSVFTRGAAAFLKNPDQVQTLFGRPRSPVTSPLPPQTQEDVPNE